MIEEKYRKKIEKFLEKECLGKSAMDRLSGFHVEDDPEAIAYRKQLAKFFTDQAFNSKPVASFIGIKEATDEIAGILLTTVCELKEDTDLTKYFKDLYEIFLIYI